MENKKYLLIAFVCLAVAVAYIVIPIDLIPDIIVVIGWLDDIVVSLLGLAGIIVNVLWAIGVLPVPGRYEAAYQDGYGEYREV